MYKRILVALDGSEPSKYAGQAAVAMAAASGCRVMACHIYGAEVHKRRFSEMEPGLPTKYRDEKTLSDLRTAHDRLMHEGFRALSAGYMEDFVASARKDGIEVESLTMEGRSYTGILYLAKTHKCDLISIGAEGIGTIGNGMLGGTTVRILYGAPCDVFVARCPLRKGPVLTGVDGSAESLRAVAEAGWVAGTLKKTVRLVAAYDPDFHTRVFDVMSQSLSVERQQEVGLSGQERLHDDIINDGLGKLYLEFLNEAEHRFNANDLTIEKDLVTGKAYHALACRAKECDADLIVVSRYGNHHESSSRLGSNAESLIRTTSANVLLVGGVDDKGDAAETTGHAEEVFARESALVWDSQAQLRLQRVPSFVRSMAKRAVENAVRQLGRHRVSLEDFDSVAARFGMGTRGGDE